jgi:hypothetical protein
MSTANIFEHLEEVHDVLPSINMFRKSKKKLREIEHLKQKSTRTLEEEAKIAEEPYWLSFLPPKKKLLTKNAYGIIGTINTSILPTDDCPICISKIPKECAIRTNCSHTYCGICIEEMIKKIDKRQPLKCAMCRTVTTTYDFQSEDVMIEVMNAMALNNSKYVPEKTSEPEDYIALPMIVDNETIPEYIPATLGLNESMRWVSRFSNRPIYIEEVHYRRF